MKELRIFTIIPVIIMMSLVLVAGPEMTQANGLKEYIAGGGGPGLMGNGFTYQGQLKNNGVPVNGTCDFVFNLWDRSSGGGQIGNDNIQPAIQVDNGLFSTVINFTGEFNSGGTPAFQGDLRYLQINVRCPSGTGQFTPLSPRQLNWAVPYALTLAPTSTGSRIYGNAYQVLKVTNNTTQTGIPAGVTGEISASVDGVGVYGGNTVSTAGATGMGVWGRTTAPDGIGVKGTATATGELYNYGGYFEAFGNKGFGMYAEAHGNTAVAVVGYTAGASSIGVNGVASGSNGIGVRGSGISYDFYAGGSGKYGPFTGAHDVKLSKGFPGDSKPGMIVSVTGETWIKPQENGIPSLSSTLPTVKLASQAADKAVFGVLVAEGPLPEGHWYEAKKGERFATVNALGEGRVWVSNINGDIAVGDYIITSSIPGYGQRQDDDLLRSSTLGKAIETVDWDSVTETVEYEGLIFKVYLIGVVYTSG